MIWPLAISSDVLSSRRRASPGEARADCAQCRGSAASAHCFSRQTLSHHRHPVASLSRESTGSNQITAHFALKNDASLWQVKASG
mmetsp:Transcript_47943/g.127151  ORF Transcript_47943/g.127151 Transcript_47943/m.127151 type:complete len:85 (-) Transcript_47943:152-406(-)